MNNEFLEDADVPWTNPIDEDFHVAMYAALVSESFGHMLFVPKYNTPGVIQDAFFDAYRYGTELVKSGKADGFNIRMDVGTSAGQNVNWPHIHLIPRYN